jgi:hypothetical protein
MDHLPLTCTSKASCKSNLCGTCIWWSLLNDVCHHFLNWLLIVCLPIIGHSEFCKLILIDLSCLWLILFYQAISLFNQVTSSALQVTSSALTLLVMSFVK